MAVTAPSFTGFRPEAIQFLADLAGEQRARLVPAAQGGVRAAPEGADGGALRRAGGGVPRPGHPAPCGPGAVAVPDLPRHAVLEGQVAVQDARRGELRLGRRRRRRGHRPLAHGERPRQRRLLPSPAGRDLRRRRGLASGQGVDHGVPRARRGRLRRVPRSRRGAGVPGDVRRQSATTASRSSGSRPASRRTTRRRTSSG